MYFPRKVAYENSTSQVITAGTSGTVSVVPPPTVELKSLSIDAGGATISSVSVDGVSITPSASIDLTAEFGQPLTPRAINITIDNTSGTADVTATVTIRGIDREMF